MRRQSQKQSTPHKHHDFARDQLHDSALPTAQGHADADFPSALCDQISQNGVGTRPVQGSKLAMTVWISCAIMPVSPAVLTATPMYQLDFP
ncbi:MAG TPA: hypothetical protein VNW97_21565 [Candidatus Saccharimonadales bacterium]|nr:hypothetical protein [Candidatus Saccharimonadales bacterium]